MKKVKYFLLVSLILICLSVILFAVHFAVFGQLENTLYYSLMSLCFIPVNVLAVTLVFENLLAYQAKQERLSKLNMLVGVFFSELGFHLLDLIVQGDDVIKERITDFSDLKTVKMIIKSHSHLLEMTKIDYDALKELMVHKGSILVTLISNESILEHEVFSDLLMSTIHLRDEILFRQNKTYTEEDYVHIAGDISRVYKALTTQWIDYLVHLKCFYPYLYKSALEASPFLNLVI
ncbi:MAG: hypothetical protein K0S71_1477 [Clostridia bacterium]|jgi:hypothetical protein|nr:hypothetical protein [Clostridia bacterium]